VVVTVSAGLALGAVDVAGFSGLPGFEFIRNKAVEPASIAIEAIK
jgi:hypothetical protein